MTNNMTNNDNSVLLIEQKTNTSNNSQEIPNYDFKTVCMKERVFLKEKNPVIYFYYNLI